MSHPKKFILPDRAKIRTALISVSDKTGIVEFARALNDCGIAILSTGGTAAVLQQAEIAVQDVSEVTGFPEIMDGRVKTLHPAIHGGLLGVRNDPQHQKAMAEHNIKPIDLLVINLYPFEKAVADNANYDEAVENIDIGGPAMIRAAAKNHGFVCVVTEPDDYGLVLEAIEKPGKTTNLALRKNLAQKAFARVSAYDAAISNWLGREIDQPIPAWRSFAGRLQQKMRYGENPHQSAGFYLTGERRPGVASAVQLQGKALSYNNINDTDAAFELLAEFSPDDPAVAIIKHANPCGAALGDTLAEAYEKALACDPVSAFGGIIALNRALDAQAAAAVIGTFTEVIIAPDADEEARAIIAARKNLRLLLTGGMPDPGAAGLMVRSVAGGLLVQDRDNRAIDDIELEVVTKKVPDAAQIVDLKFAWSVAKHVKSNAIVYVKDRATVGIGAGQMSRVDSARIAARKAQDTADTKGHSKPLTRGSAVASDAFFPFADGLLSVIEAGATCVIQPGGSMRDDEVIKAADEAGIAMVFTGTRHFRH